MNDIDKINIKKFNFRKNDKISAKDIVGYKVLCFGVNFVCIGVILTGEEEIL